MAKFRNISPLGALDIPALGQIVQPGEVFEVAKDLHPYFEAQPGNFELLRPVKPPKPPKEAKPSLAKPTDTSATESKTEEKGATDGHNAA